MISKDKSFEASKLWKQTIKQCTKNRTLKIKNSPLKLEKYFKPIMTSITDMDNFEEKRKRNHKEEKNYKKYLVRLVLSVN